MPVSRTTIRALQSDIIILFQLLNESTADLKDFGLKYSLFITEWPMKLLNISITKEDLFDNFEQINLLLRQLEINPNRLDEDEQADNGLVISSLIDWIKNNPNLLDSRENSEITYAERLTVNLTAYENSIIQEMAHNLPLYLDKIPDQGDLLSPFKALVQGLQTRQYIERFDVIKQYYLEAEEDVKGGLSNLVRKIQNTHYSSNPKFIAWLSKLNQTLQPILDSTPIYLITNLGQDSKEKVITRIDELVSGLTDESVFPDFRGIDRWLYSDYLLELNLLRNPLHFVRLITQKILNNVNNEMVNFWLPSKDKFSKLHDFVTQHHIARQHPFWSDITLLFASLQFDCLSPPIQKYMMGDTGFISKVTATIHELKLQSNTQLLIDGIFIFLDSVYALQYPGVFNNYEQTLLAYPQNVVDLATDFRPRQSVFLSKSSSKKKLADPYDNLLSAEEAEYSLVDYLRAIRGLIGYFCETIPPEERPDLSAMDTGVISLVWKEDDKELYTGDLRDYQGIEFYRSLYNLLKRINKVFQALPSVKKIFVAKEILDAVSLCAARVELPLISLYLNIFSNEFSPTTEIEKYKNLLAQNIAQYYHLQHGAVDVYEAHFLPLILSYIYEKKWLPNCHLSGFVDHIFPQGLRRPASWEVQQHFQSKFHMPILFSLLQRHYLNLLENAPNGRIKLDGMIELDKLPFLEKQIKKLVVERLLDAEKGLLEWESKPGYFIYHQGDKYEYLTAHPQLFVDLSKGIVTRLQDIGFVYCPIPDNPSVLLTESERQQLRQLDLLRALKAAPDCEALLAAAFSHLIIAHQNGFYTNLDIKLFFALLKNGEYITRGNHIAAFHAVFLHIIVNLKIYNVLDAELLYDLWCYKRSLQAHSNGNQRGDLRVMAYVSSWREHLQNIYTQVSFVDRACVLPQQLGMELFYLLHSTMVENDANNPLGIYLQQGITALFETKPPHYIQAVLSVSPDTHDGKINETVFYLLVKNLCHNNAMNRLYAIFDILLLDDFCEVLPPLLTTTLTGAGPDQGKSVLFLLCDAFHNMIFRLTGEGSPVEYSRWLFKILIRLNPDERAFVLSQLVKGNGVISQGKTAFGELINVLLHSPEMFQEEWMPLLLDTFERFSTTQCQDVLYSGIDPKVKHANRGRLLILDLLAAVNHALATHDNSLSYKLLELSKHALTVPLKIGFSADNIQAIIHLALNICNLVIYDESWQVNFLKYIHNSLGYYSREDILSGNFSSILFSIFKNVRGNEKREQFVVNCLQLVLNSEDIHFKFQQFFALISEIRDNVFTRIGLLWKQHPNDKTLNYWLDEIIKLSLQTLPPQLDVPHENKNKFKYFSDRDSMIEFCSQQLRFDTDEFYLMESVPQRVLDQGQNETCKLNAIVNVLHALGDTSAVVRKNQRGFFDGGGASPSIAVRQIAKRQGLSQVGEVYHHAKFSQLLKHCNLHGEMESLSQEAFFSCVEKIKSSLRENKPIILFYPTERGGISTRNSGYLEHAATIVGWYASNYQYYFISMQWNGYYIMPVIQTLYMSAELKNGHPSETYIKMQGDSWKHVIHIPQGMEDPEAIKRAIFDAKVIHTEEARADEGLAPRFYSISFANPNHQQVEEPDDKPYHGTLS